MEKRLTHFSSGSGCGCKIHPAKLEEILKDVRSDVQSFPNLLVGNEASDDASVLKINDEWALVQTVDFFTPIVDDPYVFGQIAAANALSDVYAMGGKPLMANALLCWPVEELPAEQASKVLEGAKSVCDKASIPLAGGHSINIKEIAFGLSVTGTVHPQKILKNTGAVVGDVLFLTKPLGTGILSTALKRGKLNENGYEALLRVATELNTIGAELVAINGVHAVTDVTGFGLYGHLIEMCKASEVSAEVYFDKVPKIAEAVQYIQEFILPDNTFRNWNSYAQFIDCPLPETFAWLNDPQTNGGLLFAVAEHAVDTLLNTFQKHGTTQFLLEPIGRILPKDEKIIYVKR
ncbi:selenide, water dikinase [Thermaurantimonas aggregans]|uniref:Selenide, water dikinase n=1 Tax=Thermaurantimonas aggregans TaxID=2173829 RepID=A0A401XNH0_9FLAO|nr:selenide, water dikinase SelD [Thermaurantimonas aggregans]MCX8149815.1 selenide, water dikinase SelD [Thermaurantimonas aggregans]GCD78566.1 selenide, water dikinase [Thermaurantimonas aggregans]